MTAIQTKAITKYYGSHIGVENIDLEVEAGEKFGFIGPNGAGKTTTIRLLLNHLFPDSGQAKIFGHDIVTASVKIKEITGYLPAGTNFYSKMKVLDFLVYNSSFYKEKPQKTKIFEYADFFDLDPDKRIEELSSGNKKKVAIIQAFVHNPKLLILDEPTGGLDPLMQSKLFDLIEEENEKGKTIFFSSHVLSDVQKICDRVAIIRKGHIIKTESIESLRENMFKRVKIAFHDKDQIKKFQIDSKLNPKVENNKLIFNYTASINDLLKHLSRFDIDNLTIEDASLDEIFMQYYINEDEET